MKDIKTIFSKNLNDLMKQRGENLTQLSDAIDVAFSTVSSWKHGEKMPRSGALQKLATHYNVNITYLTSDHSDVKPQTADLSDDDVIFTYQGKPLTEEDKALIRRLMNGK